jgi:hypothetical protein
MKTKNVTERYKGMTFAQASKKISDKYKDRDTNPMAKRSFMAEMEELVRYQEVVRASVAAVETLQENRKPLKQFGGFAAASLPLMSYLTSARQKQLESSTNTVLSPLDSKIPTFQQIGLGDVKRSSTINVNKPLATLPSTMPTSITPTTAKSFQERTLPDVQASRIPVTAPTTEGASILSPLMLGKGLELAGKTAMALMGRDRIRPELNPYESEARQELNNLRTDFGALRQQYMQQAAASRGMTSNIGSEAMRQALNQNTQSNLLQGLASAELQGQGMENQYRQARASGLQALGAETVRARQYAEQLDTQGKATSQLGLQSIFESVGNVGQRVTDFKAGIAQQEMLANVLRTKNFKFNTNALTNAYKEGKIDDQDFIAIITESKSEEDFDKNLQAKIAARDKALGKK